MKKRIFVVDDDSEIRESLGKLLRTEGYDVMLADDGQDSIKKFSTKPVDLVLLDLSLPDSTGWDVFGILTTLNRALPIIIITGRPDQEKLARAAGAAAIMEKPLDVPRLLKTIAELVVNGTEARLKRVAALPPGVINRPRTNRGLSDAG